MRRRTPVYITAALLFLSLPSTGLTEYIRATNEEEIILVSTESEIKMGKSLSKRVEKKFGVVDDIFLQKRIEELGQKIASICDRKDIPYYFKVLEGKELKPEQRINAFALPGGYIYIFKDMVELLENDDEISAILAHEVGHIAAKHGIKKLQGSLGAMALQLLTAGMTRNSNSASRTNAAIGLLMTSYSREDEAMADKLSVRYVKKIGYDPKAVIKTIDKMIGIHRKMPIRTYTAYHTHPYLSERKALVKREIYGRVEFVDFINAPVVLGDN